MSVLFAIIALTTYVFGVVTGIGTFFALLILGNFESKNQMKSVLICTVLWPIVIVKLAIDTWFELPDEEFEEKDAIGFEAGQ
jgi:hypothetical protein